MTFWEQTHHSVASLNGDILVSYETFTGGVKYDIIGFDTGACLKGGHMIEWAYVKAGYYFSSSCAWRRITTLLRKDSATAIQQAASMPPASLPIMSYSLLDTCTNSLNFLINSIQAQYDLHAHTEHFCLWRQAASQLWNNFQSDTLLGDCRHTGSGLSINIHLIAAIVHP